MNKTKNGINGMSVEDLKIMDEIIDAKLQDAEIPGFQAQFDPMEAERIGAFEEDALSEQDALDSVIDQQV